MELLQFKGAPLWINLAVFSCSALAVWLAGTRLARYVDTIARRSGIGHAAAGLLLLAGVTSLPEVAVTVTASAGGNAELALNNLLGSIAMQVAILAVADALIGKDALTSVIPDPVVLLQLALNNLLLALFAAAALTGDVGFLGIGAWSSVLLAGYIGSVWVIARSQGRRSWVAADMQRDRSVQAQSQQESGSTSIVIAKTTGSAAVILVAGFLLSRPHHRAHGNRFIRDIDCVLRWPRGALHVAVTT